MSECERPTDQNCGEMKLPARSLVRMLWVLTFAVSVYALSLAVKIWTLDALPSGAEGGFISVTAAIFGILITGVFVFMTFRIDRGARIEARAVAEEEAKKRLGDIQVETRETSERFTVRVAERLRESTEAVLRRRNENLDCQIRPVTLEDGRRD